MLRFTLLLILGLFSISCSKTNFSSSDEQAFLASGITCHDDKCLTYTVNENAKSSELNNKANILFVFDTSGTMDEENLELANRMEGFVESLDKKNVQYNLCYTIADDTIFKSGSVERWASGEHVLNHRTADVAGIFSRTIDSIKGYNGSNEEEPIAATYAMINSGLNSDCLQKNIPLEVVILSDEDEVSCADHCDFGSKISNFLRGSKLRTDNYPKNLIQLAEEKLPQTPFTVNAIVKQKGVSQNCSVSGDNNGEFHIELAMLTGGIIGDICFPDYTSQLSDISQSIQATLNDIPLRCNPIDGIKLTASNGMTFSQDIIKNSLHLPPAIPGGVSVDLTYDCRAE